MKSRKADMFELTYNQIKLSLFGWVTFVEVTTRCACCSIVNWTCRKHVLLIFYLSRGLCLDCVHIMQTIVTPRTIIKYLTNVFRFLKSTSSFKPLSTFTSLSYPCTLMIWIYVVWMNLPVRATCVVRLHSQNNAMKLNSHHQKLN